MDLVQWLDARITQQVQHQLEQRLAQEGEYWRCDVVDLIAEERERMNALLRDVHKDIVDLTRENNERPLDRVDQILKQSDKTIVEMCTGVDRIEAKLDPMRSPDDDGEEPPSKH